MMLTCASALSTEPETRAASREVLDRVAGAFGDGPADLVLVFASIDHAEGLGALVEDLRARGLGGHVLGCTGEWIVGEGREVEGGPALSLWAIRLPGAVLRPVRLNFVEGEPRGWPDDLEPAGPSGRTLLLLADPFTFPADDWFGRIEAAEDPPRVVGGMASGAQEPGRNRLVLDGEVFDSGAVGIAIEGPGVEVRTVVSQGCRPIGRPMIVTRVESNRVRELGRRPALDVLREQFAELDEAEQDLVRQGLHLGRVINEYQDAFRRGDFLVRNVLGVDESGAIALNDPVRVGQTVQFHVRDAETAAEDLRSLLDDARPDRPPAGALLFTCNGRGSRLFPAPGHDVGAIRERLGPIPVAGFFAMGELGPIGGQNFVHGFTASVALFSAGTGPEFTSKSS